MLILLCQNLSFSLTLLLTSFCSNLEIFFFYERIHGSRKSRTNGPITKCIEESCPATFDNCFGVKNSWFKYVVISSKGFAIFSCGIAKVNSLVFMTCA